MPVTKANQPFEMSRNAGFFEDFSDDAIGQMLLRMEGTTREFIIGRSSGAAEPSHVLRAMGLEEREVEQSIRVSFHSGSCADDVARCIDTLERVVKNLRALHV